MEKNLVFISDTHGLHDRIQVPDGDILIHCGDMSSRGFLNEVQKFSNWFCKLPHKYKVVIPGNHDFIFEKNDKIHKELFEDRGVIFLNDSHTEVEGIKIWGSPITPYFNNWAFNRFRGSSIESHWNKIPEGVDIVITHGPPANIGDLGKVIEGEDVGCEDLYKTLVKRVKPKINCFGHIHEGYGTMEQDEIIFINCSILNRSYKISNERLKLNTQKVNSLSLSDIKKDLTKSERIRELLSSMGYNSFNAKDLKGEKCYSAYYKEFFNDNNDYKYSICCYCYNFSGLIENSEAFEFVLETQLETDNGLVGMESVQWIFKDTEQAFNNIRYFENLVNNNWIFGGSNKFPNT